MMNSELKRGLYQDRLDRVANGREDFVVFTDPVSGAFIQFTRVGGENPGEVLLDIPPRAVNSSQPSAHVLTNLLPELRESGSPYAGSYGVTCSVKDAVAFSERFFTECCEFSPDHDVRIDP